MLILLFKFISRIPLTILHFLSNILGYVMYYAAPRERNKIAENLQIAQLPHDKKSVLHVCQETIKGGLELPVAFFRQPEEISALFHEVYGWEHIQAALSQNQGLLLLTPHLGSYDLAGRYLSERLPFPLTAMYKPPQIKAFNEIMQLGRVRGKGKTAPTNLQGVKQIIKALRAGEATIVLPDHVPDPAEGDGVWAHFFGKPALTMTLASKLAQINHVRTLFFVGERLTNGRGFALHIAPLSGSLNGNKQHDAQIINNNIEQWIRHFPEQYLFAYNRFKNPTAFPPTVE